MYPAWECFRLNFGGVGGTPPAGEIDRVPIFALRQSGAASPPDDFSPEDFGPPVFVSDELLDPLDAFIESSRRYPSEEVLVVFEPAAVVPAKSQVLNFRHRRPSHLRTILSDYPLQQPVYLIMHDVWVHGIDGAVGKMVGEIFLHVFIVGRSKVLDDQLQFLTSDGKLRNVEPRNEVVSRIY